MPRHRVYIEPFLGSGAILKRKRPAEMSFTCELNREQFEAFIPGENFPLTGCRPPQRRRNTVLGR